MIDLNTRMASIKSILCLNGQFPFKLNFQKGIPIVATDGAGFRLISLGIIPDVVIGDFDSVCFKKLPVFVEKIYTPDQNYTDFEKTLVLLRRRNLFPCLIYGVSGKEMDHFVYNLHVIARLSDEFSVIFQDAGSLENEQFGIITSNNFKGQFVSQSLMSIIPYPESKVSTQGLKWELQEAKLTIEGSSSIRNRVAGGEVVVKIHSGKVLVTFKLD
jgi:thiamine pyrophosphokinase